MKQSAKLNVSALCAFVHDMSATEQMLCRSQVQFSVVSTDYGQAQCTCQAPIFCQKQFTTKVAFVPPKCPSQQILHQDRIVDRLTDVVDMLAPVMLGRGIPAGQKWHPAVSAISSRLGHQNQSLTQWQSHLQCSNMSFGLERSDER